MISFENLGVVCCSRYKVVGGMEVFSDDQTKSKAIGESREESVVFLSLQAKI